MNDVERWIYLGGTPPEHIQRVLDVLRREESPETPEDLARESVRFGAKLGALLGYAPDPAPEIATPAPLPAPGQVERAPAPLSAGAPPVSEAIPEPAPPASLPLRSKLALLGTAPPWSGPVPSVLPFVPPLPGGAPPPSPPVPGPRADKTLQTAARGPAFGKTASLDVGKVRQAIAPAVPFEGSTVGPAVVFFPELTITAYCEMCAELRTWPHKLGAILTRYGVQGPMSHAALEQHWSRRLAESPQQGADVTRYTAQYAEWLGNFPRCPYP
jgi:hypothetical protein